MMDKEEEKAVVDTLYSGMIISGPRVKDFEKRFAEYLGVKYAVAVNSGTAALHTALFAAGIGKNDEVITTPFTFVATANSILMQNAKVVFADVEEDTFNIDTHEAKKKLTKNTKAIIPVDLYGQTYDFDALRKVMPGNVVIIEDACQSLGAEFNGKKAGLLGNIGTFSLYATKNITAAEGGMIVTDNADYANKAKMFRNHGQDEKYEYLDIGYNYRMCDILASIGIEQLKKIDDFVKSRMENADFFMKNLDTVKQITLPTTLPGNKHVYNQFTIKVDERYREKLFKHLRENKVNAVIYYPKPLHLTPAFAKYSFKEGQFPVAEKVAKQVISLPVHPGLSKKDLKKIVTVIKNFQW